MLRGLICKFPKSEIEISDKTRQTEEAGSALQWRSQKVCKKERRRPPAPLLFIFFSIAPPLPLVYRKKMAKGISSSDDVVIKAQTDHRYYRVLHLPNGLTAVLVHDPEIFPEKLPEDSRTQETDNDEDEPDDEEDEDGDGDEEEDDDDEEEEDEKEEMGEEGEGESKKRKDGAMPTKKVVFFLRNSFFYRISSSEYVHQSMDLFNYLSFLPCENVTESCVVKRMKVGCKINRNSGQYFFLEIYSSSLNVS